MQVMRTNVDRTVRRIVTLHRRQWTGVEFRGPIDDLRRANELEITFRSFGSKAEAIAWAEEVYREDVED